MVDASIMMKQASRGGSSRSILWLTMVTLATLFVWSAFAQLDEVAVGEGKVTPASRGQVIQSLEGGILSELFVREGDIVELGQKLARLDPVQARTAVEEALARIAAFEARSARLQAEMNDAKTVDFPPDVQKYQEVVERENELFLADRRAFEDNVANLEQQLGLAQRELDMVAPLLRTGASNEVEVLKLRQKVAEFTTKIAATRSEYYVALRADFAKTMADLEPLLKIREGRADQLRRTVITSPARGIVKDIRISTIGGVVAAGGVLMEIVPLGDQLLIEARLSPKDIAFIRPGQDATVKITAYESSVYGTLPAKVDRVSPDTIEDQTDKRIYYYRVYVLTDHSFLETKDGKRHPILPGMVATAEIKTGKKTVLAYLLKPLNRAGEALRER
jgi:membrane fusion protein, adhesin transport system